jgi:hypothetical protein
MQVEEEASPRRSFVRPVRPEQLVPGNLAPTALVEIEPDQRRERPLCSALSAQPKAQPSKRMDVAEVVSHLAGFHHQPCLDQPLALASSHGSSRGALSRNWKSLMFRSYSNNQIRCPGRILTRREMDSEARKRLELY